jgi:hypothetical protein
MLSLQTALERIGLCAVGCAGDDPSTLHASRKLNLDIVILDSGVYESGLSIATQLAQLRIALALLLASEDQRRLTPSP